jgi:hypothetical protein
MFKVFEILMFLKIYIFVFVLSHFVVIRSICSNISEENTAPIFNVGFISVSQATIPNVSISGNSLPSSLTCSSQFFF